MKMRFICFMFSLASFFSSTANAENFRVNVQDVLNLATYQEVGNEEVNFQKDCSGVFKVSSWNWQPSPSSEINYRYEVIKLPSVALYQVRFTKEIKGTWGKDVLLDEVLIMSPGESKTLHSHYHQGTDLILRQEDRLTLEL